jgi:GNAT superfamily N-acetyltransferase
MALISIAHPSFRAELLDAGKERHYVFMDQITSELSYPRKYEKRIEIEGLAPVLMRPIRVTDEAKISRLFYSLSDATVYKRWHHDLKQLPHRDILRLLEVDYTKNMAVVVEAESGDEESRLVGVGRYHTDPATNYAETAFVIRDDWQRHGLGTALLQHVIEIARENGVAGFTAEVLADNWAMRHVFHKSGLEIQSQLNQGVYSLVMDLSPAKEKGETPPKKRGRRPRKS